MVNIIHKLGQLKFSELMYVYSEANFETGNDRYPNTPIDTQMREVELDFYNYLREVFFCQQNSFYAVLEVNSKYKAALRMEPFKDGWLLCALETAPCERRKGYATSLIEGVLKHMSKYGNTKVYSHVSKRNLPSISTHIKCGFSIALDYAVYSDGSVLHTSYTLVYDIKTSET